MKAFALKMIAAVCVAALLACSFLVFKKGFRIGSNYADAEQYTAGGATLNEMVKSLDIHWTAGSITIAYHDQDTVQIAETASGKIPADGELRWWLDGDTLRVQYAKSGYFSFRSLKKALTVTLPEGSRLDSFAVDASSADVISPVLSADDARISLSSGDIHSGFNGARAVRVDLTSGTVELSQSGTAESMAVSTTSGDIRLSLSDVNALAAKATSGCISVAGGEVERAEVSSTSGGISVSLAAFDELKIDATSGDVKAELPSEPGYTADVKATSGHLEYSVALKRDGDSYSCGDGSGRLRIRTTSGDVLLTQAGGQ